jgi:hypothetical protein
MWRRRCFARNRPPVVVACPRRQASREIACEIRPPVRMSLQDLPDNRLLVEFQRCSEPTARLVLLWKSITDPDPIVKSVDDASRLPQALARGEGRKADNPSTRKSMDATPGTGRSVLEHHGSARLSYSAPPTFLGSHSTRFVVLAALSATRAPAARLLRQPHRQLE